MKQIIAAMIVGMVALTGSAWASGGGYGHYGSTDSKPVYASKARVALDGYCAVCLVDGGKKILGSQKFALEFAGQQYLFPSMEQLNAFRANPKKYVEKAPQILEKMMKHAGHDHGSHGHEGSHH